MLDVACGPGLISCMSAKSLGASADIVGVDVADGLLEVARQKATSNMRFAQAHAVQLPLRWWSLMSCCEPVLCFDVAAVQHLPDVDTAVAAWRRVLRPHVRMHLQCQRTTSLFVLECYSALPRRRALF